jgi:hypothetical protein
MTKISSDLLKDTFNLVQLARETALARGNTAQAEKLGPVAQKMRSIAETSRQQPASGPRPTQGPPPSGGILGQSDFQALLAVTQSTPRQEPGAAASLERNGVVAAMASAGMAELDIARYLGITRDEVRMILASGARTAR